MSKLKITLLEFTQIFWYLKFKCRVIIILLPLTVDALLSCGAVSSSASVRGPWARQYSLSGLLIELVMTSRVFVSPHVKRMERINPPLRSRWIAKRVLHYAA